MMQETVTINLENGLEARPVALLVQVASQYDSTIYIQSQNKKVNAKSIMGMMCLGLEIGEEVTVQAEGQDETAAIDGVGGFLKGKTA